MVDAHSSTSQLAAELIAFEVFEPTLRCRGTITARAREIKEDKDFQKTIIELFHKDALGKLIIPTLQDALNRLEQLEERMIAIERGLSK